jgi:hypothetical protein
MSGAWWLLCYLVAMVAISWGGSLEFGGKGYLPYGWDLLIVALVGVGFFMWGIKSGWRTVHLDTAGDETRH